MRSLAPFAFLACTLAPGLVTAGAAAAAPSKDDCVDAHARGQDAREAGLLGKAGKLFLSCAQAACPDLVRAECSRLADEVDRDQPTLTFAARGGGGADLPDTAVFVDGVQVAAQLGDGRAYEIDPGRHEVHFVRAGDDVTLTIVVALGEKSRPVIGTFAGPKAPSPSPAATEAPPPAAASPALRRPAGPLALVVIGALAATAGGAVLGAGFARVPAPCSLTAHTCAVPPGDPTIGRASGAVTLIDVGAVAGGAGAAMLGAGLIWYFAQPMKPRSTAITPWIGPGLAGMGLTLSL